MKTIKNMFLIGAVVSLFGSCANSSTGSEQQVTLSEAMKEKFLMGVAVNHHQAAAYGSTESNIIRSQFNSVVAENCMKSEVIHPQKDRYDFTKADQFVEFGEKNNMFIIGHTLIWHSQLSPWFTVDENGKDVSRDELINRMRDHIHTIVGRYKGRVHGWDVVNEAFLDNGDYRNTKFYEIIGEDYIPMAFRFVNEVDPEAELYYNDYSMALQGRREAVVRMVSSLKEQGIRVDGVGMQSHIALDYPDFKDFETSLKAFAATGAKVHITELDMSVLPMPDRNVGADVSASFEYQSKLNPYTGGLPADIDRQWNDRMYEFFKMLMRNSEDVKRVTLWGFADQNSWKNDWPVAGRMDYPLLFDRDYQPKAVVDSIIRHNEVTNL